MKSRLLILLLMMISPFAWSHKSSDSFINLTIADETVSGRWDIALRDLDFALGLDNNADGAITWGELRGQYEQITDYAFASIQVKNGTHLCSHQSGILQVDHHTDGAYAVVNFVLNCAKPIEALVIQYQLLFDLDPNHRGLIQVQRGEHSEFLIFSPDHNVAEIDFKQSSHWAAFRQFVSEGIWHIWIGYDHILFLLCLLLPSVVRKVPGGWVQTDKFSTVFWQVGKIVTAFTLAHSLTLLLAVLEVISLPSRLVESAIALSVILAAVNNLKPFFSERTWLIAFAFGLIHGFGFASVLTDIGLTTSNLGIALLGFNIGVETGQLAIVSVFLPIAYLLRTHYFYQRIVLCYGSQIIVLIATVWFVQRAFDFSGFTV